MTRLPTYSPPGRALASLILALMLLIPAALAAETPAAAAPEDVGKLVATLEDKAQREQLIAQLKTMMAAAQASKPSREAEILERLSERAADWRIDLGTLAILGGAVAFSRLSRRVIDRALEAGNAAGKTGRTLALLHLLLRWSIGLAALFALAQLWGLEPMTLVGSGLGQQVAGALLHIAVVLVAALVAWHLLHGTIERYLTATDAEGNLRQRSGRARTLLPLARNAVFVLLVVMVGLILLSELGIDIAPLLAGAGVLGIAIGFGSQKLVQDVITGAFILFEDTVAVGDVVRIGEHAGLVEAISIRAIRLRDSNGSLHTVPFGAVSTVVNQTKGFSYALFEIGIAYSEDTDKVAAVLARLGAEMQAEEAWGRVMLDPIEVQGVERFDASSVVMRARIKTAPGDRWALTREFNRRLKKRFDAEGIEFPFPQMQVWRTEKPRIEVTPQD